MFRHLDLIFASNEICSHDNRKIVLLTQLLTDYFVIKAYRSLVQCKCKRRGLFAANWGGGGGGHSYIFEDMDVREALSNPYPLQTKISIKFRTLSRQMAAKFRKYVP